jgi:hypothetical protein
LTWQCNNWRINGSKPGENGNKPGGVRGEDGSKLEGENGIEGKEAGEEPAAGVVPAESRKTNEVML